MKIAVIAALIGTLSGTALAAENVNAAVAPAPEGYVTIQEIPEIVVVAKRWNQVDEENAKRMQELVASRNADESRVHRLLAYIGR